MVNLEAEEMENEAEKNPKLPQSLKQNLKSPQLNLKNQNELLWAAQTKEYKKEKFNRDRKVQEALGQIQETGFVSPYLKGKVDIEVKMINMFKRWCNDYVTGKTSTIPTAGAMARFYGVSHKVANKVVTPYLDRYLRHKYISESEYKDYGLDIYD